MPPITIMVASNDPSWRRSVAARSFTPGSKSPI
jgi:hypothetical protein